MVLAAGLGVLGLMESRRSLTALQLELDRCAARHTLDLRERLEDVGRLNGRIRALRTTALAATLVPEAKAALTLALDGLAARQEFVRAAWLRDQAAWSLGIGCSRGPLNASPYPGFPWRRPPPDPLGPRPLEWIGPGSRRFGLILRQAPRAAATEVKGAEGDGPETNRWSVRWTVPR